MNKTIVVDCGIVQDLLPLYIDGCCSEESIIAVEEHLENCNNCNSILEIMKNKCTTENDNKPEVLKPTYVNGWKASLLQSVLLFVSFGVLSVGITLEAYTPYGANNGFWAFALIIPVASFMLSLSNWYFIKFYKNKKRFILFSVLFNFFLEIGFCVWGLIHFRFTFLESGISVLWFLGVSSGVFLVLGILTKTFSGVYAGMLGKE